MAEWKRERSDLSKTPLTTTNPLVSNKNLSVSDMTWFEEAKGERLAASWHDRCAAAVAAAEMLVFVGLVAEITFIELRRVILEAMRSIAECG
mmetsp:Transcript_1984/g.5324  ORF Transcript_1984/g.5324 Transcript_1984/m.5324 type:complete len:92 (-) Transcript_1984:71-346(-)